VALFALDQNFPDPIIRALDEYIPEATLTPLREIDPLLAEIDDWQVLLALHQHEQPWDGLITNDAQMLRLPREMAVLNQTRLTLVVAHDSGHDPIRATGLLFTHLGHICRNTDPGTAQIWQLRTKTPQPTEPWDCLRQIADRRDSDVQALWAESRLTAGELRVDPLA
jgi:hypothetical protein